MITLERREKEGRTERGKQRQINRYGYREKETERQMERQTDKLFKATDRHIDKETDRRRYRQT